jgi:hypothetical protein
MALDAFDDFVESEVAVAAAATAALLSPRVRGLLRSGAVYGLAGLLTAGDTISSLVRSVVRFAHGAQYGPTTAAQGLQDITAPVRQRTGQRGRPGADPYW